MSVTPETILSFLTNVAGIDRSVISEESTLFSSGLVDSFSMLELITFIENEEGIRFDPTDVSLENLDSINQILGFVSRKRG